MKSLLTPYSLLLTLIISSVPSISCYHSHQTQKAEKTRPIVQEISSLPELKMKPELLLDSLYERTCMGPVSSHPYLGRQKAGVQVIENQVAYDEAIDKNWGTKDPLTTIDFNKYIVVAAYAGQQSDCGYKVLLFKPEETPTEQNNIIFVVTAQCPYDDVNESASNPVTFVKLPRLEDGSQYKFIREERTDPEVCYFTRSTSH